MTVQRKKRRKSNNIARIISLWNDKEKPSLVFSGTIGYLYFSFMFSSLTRMITILCKVLNPMVSGFAMEWDVPPSYPVPTLGTVVVSRCADQDAGTMAG